MMIESHAVTNSLYCDGASAYRPGSHVQFAAPAQVSFWHKADLNDMIQFIPVCAKSGREQAQQTAELFDHLGGACKHRSRHVQVNRLGGFEVDNQLVFGRRLYRKVCGFLAL